MAIHQLKLVGKNSGDIFMLRYPNNLLDFCGFDFSSFAKSAVDLCNEALKSGTPDYDRISVLRGEVRSAHCYIEQNIRTVYDKIVFDCWIDYVCRRDNISESGLWNRLVRCRTAFDKAIFARLCEIRYNRAVNEWLNIIRVQDYAKSKMDFVFSKELNSVEAAAARRNYFDMMFSVTAREMGCRLEDIGVTKLFTVGRIPPAPFMFPNVSKEIVRHVLTNFDYSDDYSDIGDYTESADQIAMDAFSRMKAGLPKDLAGYNISSGISDKNNGNIYMPCSLKAAVDLEFDAIIESGSWLARCKRCKRFFLRSKDHPEEYCSRSMPGEKSCLEIYEDEHPRPTMTAELERRCAKVADELYNRVDETMSVKEYESWRTYLEAMIGKVKNGEILPAELESFLSYSLEVDISKSRPIKEVAKREPEPAHERVVKPFVPERISRSDIQAQSAEPEFEEPQRPVQPPKEGFFTSPSVQRQKSERPQISHIIRNGESLGDNGTVSKPDPAGFRAFGEPPAPPVSSGIRTAELPQFAPSAPSESVTREDPRKFSAYEKLNLLEERIEQENKLRREMAERARSSRQGFHPFAEPVGSEEPEHPSEARGTVRSMREPHDAVPSEQVPQAGEYPARDTRDSGYSVNDYRGEGYNAPEPRAEERSVSEETASRPKVIRKNAAAISAYGKMAGAAFTTADPMERASDEVPDADPFKDIGSIFDVLEQSESGEDMLAGGYSDYEDYFEDIAKSGGEPSKEDIPNPGDDTSDVRVYSPRSERMSSSDVRVYDPKATRGSVRKETAAEEPRGEADTESLRSEPAAEKAREYPDHVGRENAPSGFWTEERNLFPSDDADSEAVESDRDGSVKDKRHKTNKTQRLFDAIMREPDSNPNFRKK